MPTVFVSYSRADSGFTHRLADDLRAMGYEVWIDVSGLRGGTEWAREIDRAVRACDAFVLVISPDSMASKWVSKEMTLAIELDKRVIPVMWRQAERTLSLVDIQYVDFRGDYGEAVQQLERALPPVERGPAPRPTPTQPARGDGVRSRLRRLPPLAWAGMLLVLVGGYVSDLIQILYGAAAGIPLPVIIVSIGVGLLLLGFSQAVRIQGPWLRGIGAFLLVAGVFLYGLGRLNLGPDGRSKLRAAPASMPTPPPPTQTAPTRSPPTPTPAAWPTSTPVPPTVTPVQPNERSAVYEATGRQQGEGRARSGQSMSDALLDGLIGGAFILLGGLAGLAAEAWLKAQTAERERVREGHPRPVGANEQIQRFGGVTDCWTDSEEQDQSWGMAGREWVEITGPDWELPLAPDRVLITRMQHSVEMSRYDTQASVLRPNSSPRSAVGRAHCRVVS